MININENYSRLYIEVSKKYKKISQKKQLEYLKIYRKTGDLKYLEQILYANLPLVIDIACSFNRKGENEDLFMDFISVGYEESINCLDRYKFDKGNCTVTSWIRNNVRNKIWTFLREYGKVVKINTSAYDKLSKDKKYRDKFFAKNGSFPVKGQILKEQGEVYKFKHEYEFGFVDENKEDYFNSIPDFQQLDINDNTLKEKIDRIAKNVLTPLEYTIVDLFYNKRIKMTDINKYIYPENENDIETILKTGKNSLKIVINGNKKIYNVYYSVFFNTKLKKQLPLGKKLFDDMGILNYKNIYINQMPFLLSFRKIDHIEVYYNRKKIDFELKNENKIFKIFINDKQGMVISKMHVHNLHENAIKKLRAYMLSSKINSYE